MKKNLIISCLSISITILMLPGLSYAERSKKTTYKTERSQAESTRAEKYPSNSYDPLESVLPTYNGKVELDLRTSSVALVSAAGTTSFDLSVAAYYFYSQQIEIGGALGAVSMNGVSHLGVYGLGLYNFEGPFNYAYFAGGGLGFADAGYAGAGVGTDKKMSIVAFAGKRFPLWGRLILAPVVRFEKIADVDPIISMIPFNVSIIL